MRNAECKPGIPGSFFLLVFLSVVSLAGCAQKGPVLLTAGYQAPAETAGTPSAVVVAVSPFVDSRGEQPSVLGIRTIPNGMQSDLVVQGTVAELATTSLKAALAHRGIAVQEGPSWDLTVDSIPKEGPAIVLGGEIKALWLESFASSMKTHLKAAVQLKVVAGFAGELNSIQTINVNSKLEQDVFYSRERLEELVSEALSSAIDQIFKDEELKKRLH